MAPLLLVEGKEIMRTHGLPTPVHPMHRSFSALSAAMATVLVGLLVLAGCDSGTGPGPLGEVSGVVSVEGRGFSGIEVELSGPERRVTTTDAGGRYAFTEVPTGAYVVTIRGVPSDASFSTTSRTAVLARESDRRTVTVDFSGSFIRTAGIQGRVLSRDRGVAGVTVRAEGPDTLITSSDGEGRYGFSGIRAGQYQLRISGFPSSVSFPSVEGVVQVGAGATVEFDFEGEPELTATAIITGVFRRLPSGERETLDPTNLRGRIEVDVLVDRGEETPERVELRLGSTLVGEQDFNPSETSAAGEPVPAAAPFTLTFGVDTDAFDGTTGEVRFRNGTRVLQARLSTREGGEGVWTSTIQVVLRNQDSFFGVLEPQRGPVAGSDGLEWVGGNLGVRVFPVTYSDDRTVSSVSVELRRAGGALLREREVAGTAPFLVVFPGSGEPSGANVAGYQTPAGALDQLRVRSALYTDGSSVSGAPFLLVDELRVDNVPPPGGSFVLPAQGSERNCCLGNWVGGAHLFAAGFTGQSDAGVGGESVTFHAGPAALTNEELAARPAVETGAELQESSSNAAYRAVALYRDALDNRRIIPLAPSEGNPEGIEGGAVFGVDRTPPEVRFASASLQDRAVNPPSESGWIVRAEDRESGFSSLPARTTLRYIAPGVDGAASCPFPGTSVCSPQPDPLVRALPASGQGYFFYRTRVLDRAGNSSPELLSRVLRDVTAPQVENLERPTGPEAGSTMSLSAPASDNVDLHLATFVLHFGPSNGEPGFDVGFAPPDTLGHPFDGSPVASVTARRSMPVVAAVEVAGGGPGDAFPSGVLHPLTGARVRVQDAAGNATNRDGSIVPTVESELVSFSVTARGDAEGVRRWQLAADGATVCARRGALSGGGSCTGVAPDDVILTATARGQGGVFGRPFERVHFYALVGNELRWLGSADEAVMTNEGAGPEGRSWSWSLNWTPELDFPSGAHPLVVVGIDERGTALRSPNAEGPEVLGAGAGG